MLLELDPDTAAGTISQLAILDAEDAALRIADHGHAALAAAHAHSNNTRANFVSSPDDAARVPTPAGLTAFTARMTSASDRAFTAWHQILIPLLRDACVLTDTPPAGPALAGRRWADTRLRLAGLDATYPGQIAARRHHATGPIVRFTLDVCRAIAADLHAHDPHHHLGLQPVVLIDADQPVLVAAADNLDAAWRSNATTLQPDPDGWWPLGSRQWPWRADPTTPPVATRHRVHHPVRTSTQRRTATRTVAI
jgi:hypothetical protein